MGIAVQAGRNRRGPGAAAGPAGSGGALLRLIRRHCTLDDAASALEAMKSPTPAR